ncbi:hypothetical protein [Ketogulonicigenium robustum]|nr:hypothetical protein [Ketogulonicigenium robustum]
MVRILLPRILLSLFAVLLLALSVWSGPSVAAPCPSGQDQAAVCMAPGIPSLRAVAAPCAACLPAAVTLLPAPHGTGQMVAPVPAALLPIPAQPHTFWRPPRLA